MARKQTITDGLQSYFRSLALLISFIIRGAIDINAAIKIKKGTQTQISEKKTFIRCDIDGCA